MNAPTGLSGTTTITQANLSWNAVSGATAYKVYRNGVKVSDTTEEQFKDTGLTASTMYRYKVSAMNQNVESDLSNELELTTQASGS